MDMNTFLATLYVTVDDFCNIQLPTNIRPGAPASLSQSEVVTLAILSQWQRFSSERDFYRYADNNLRGAFPNLPHRSQLNRQIRQHSNTIAAFCLHLADGLGAGKCAYEALDATAVPTRNAKRIGSGWLAGTANVGWSNRLGWYEGFNLLTSVTPDGVVTGFCFAPASSNERPMAETFFELRKHPDPYLISVGAKPDCPYIADKGFSGVEHLDRWRTLYGAEVICPSRKGSKRYCWPKNLLRWYASLRQIVETIYDKLHNTFRLCKERPHDLTGFSARLAAKMALHNFCIWTNNLLGRKNLEFADLISW